MRTRRPILAAATAIVVVLMLAAPVLATGTGLTSVSGYAYGESVDVMDGTPVAIHVTSGPIPATPQFDQTSDFSSTPATLASVCAGVTGCDVLSASVLAVHTDGTVGAAGSVHSTASVATVNALAGLVTGDLVVAQCAVDSSGNTSGSSTLTNVQFNGITAASNPGPNTQLVLLNAGNVAIGTITLNEQMYDSQTNTLTVNAIHIHLTSAVLGLTGDIIISHVACDSSPAGVTPVIPESPLAILLPLSALLVGGGAVLVVLRRTSAVKVS